MHFVPLPSRKVCSRCKIEKSADQFYQRARKRIVNYQYTDDYWYRLSAACKICEIKRNRENPIYAEKRRLYEKHKRSERKIQLINFYSKGKDECVCCKENNVKFLSMDHINGGGKEHREQIAKELGWQDLYKWLIKHNFPEGFQVLCYNCNFGRQQNGGICPHKEAEHD